jgi:hypothetical protein
LPVTLTGRLPACHSLVIVGTTVAPDRPDMQQPAVDAALVDHAEIGRLHHEAVAEAPLLQRVLQGGRPLIAAGSGVFRCVRLDRGVEVQLPVIDGQLQLRPIRHDHAGLGPPDRHRGAEWRSGRHYPLRHRLDDVVGQQRIERPDAERHPQPHPGRDVVDGGVARQVVDLPDIDQPEIVDLRPGAVGRRSHRHGRPLPDERQPRHGSRVVIAARLVGDGAGTERPAVLVPRGLVIGHEVVQVDVHGVPLMRCASGAPATRPVAGA